MAVVATVRKDGWPLCTTCSRDLSHTCISCSSPLPRRMPVRCGSRSLSGCSERRHTPFVAAVVARWHLCIGLSHTSAPLDTLQKDPAYTSAAPVLVVAAAVVVHRPLSGTASPCTQSHTCNIFSVPPQSSQPRTYSRHKRSQQPSEQPNLRESGSQTCHHSGMGSVCSSVYAPLPAVAVVRQAACRQNPRCPALPLCVVRTSPASICRT